MSGIFSWTKDERRQARLYGARIAAARKALGLTQDAVANKLGINQVRVSAVERGRSDLSRSDIAATLGVEAYRPNQGGSNRGARP